MLYHVCIECCDVSFDCIFSDGVDEGIEWLVQCVQRNAVNRPPTQKDIT